MDGIVPNRLALRTGYEVISYLVRLQFPFDGDRCFCGALAP